MARQRILAMAVVLLVAAAAAAAPPGDVGATLLFSGPDDVTWSGVAGATAYNVYRGAARDGSDLTCLEFRIAPTSASDGEQPPLSGDLFTYVVAAWNTDGEGPIGQASSGAPRSALVRCADDDLDGVRDDLDNCPGLANPGQEDQDLDFQGDPCDPSTYDFETDLLGTRPADVTQDGATEPGFVVRDYAGDRGVAYDAGAAGVHDRFDRVVQVRDYQDLDVYLDTADLAGETMTVELWPEGTAYGNAGNGLQVRLEPGGTIRVRTREGIALTDVGTASVADTTRVRLRLRKGSGTVSTVSLDTWNGAGWDVDVAVFTVTDDSLLAIGRGVAVANYDGGRRPIVRLTGNALAGAVDFEIARSHDTIADWKLFQRGAAGDCPIPLPVAWRSDDPVTLEARVVLAGTATPLPGFDYAAHRFDLPAAPTGATARFELAAVPEGGNYDVEARLLLEDGSILEDRVDSVAVGDVFLAAGQSNMVGTSGTLQPTEPPDDHVHLFGNDYRWKQAAEPMDASTDQIDRVSQDGNPLHSLMLRFAKDVADGIGVPVGIVPAPLGGTNLHTQWQRDDTNPTHRGTLYGSSVHRVVTQDYVYPIRGVIWYQGESDAGRTTAQYLTDLTDLVADYRGDLANPNLFFGNCQLATYAFANVEQWTQIQEAQRQQAEADARSEVVALVDLTRSDVIHLDVLSYREAGARLARAVLDGLYGVARDRAPSLLSAAFATSQRREIVLTYDRALSGGQVPGLFRVNDDRGTVTVDSAFTNGATITLGLSNRARGATTISYGFAVQPNSGWIVGADGAGAALVFRGIPVAD